MVDALRDARLLAESVRFSEDLHADVSGTTVSHTEEISSFFHQTGLRISPKVTPRLSRALGHVCANLTIPPGSVEAFVSASPELQAECYGGDGGRCVIRFTSALVNLLTEEEFGFVAGHEIGHFLLGHGVRLEPEKLPTLEHFIQQRCQEVSVDRVGLLACRSLDTALRAMMKITSGLGRTHLRFDVSTFVSQLQGASQRSWLFSETASHPSMLVRCRALLWFSLSGSSRAGKGVEDRSELLKLDERIVEDLRRYVDGPARQRIDEAREDVALWLAGARMAEIGELDPPQRTAIAHRFGSETLGKLESFLGSLPSERVDEVLKQKLREAETQMRELMPTSFDSDRGAILDEIDRLLPRTG